MTNKLSSLSSMPIETEFIVDNMSVPDDMKKKLASMGIYPGQRVKLLKNEHSKSLLIMVYNMRVILDRESGDCIWVRGKE
jgi:Fe2+ transport system protein FeoA